MVPYSQNKRIKPPAGLVIRHDIVKLVLENAGKSVKLLSARQYADRFQFSQRTVASELAKLTEEGWITGKKGVGYFTNPQHEKGSLAQKRRIAGIALGDTQLLCYDYNQWTIQAYIGMRLAPEIAHLRNLNIYSRVPKTVYQELCNEELDAFVWILPPPEFEFCLNKIRKEGAAVVTVLSEFQGIPSIQIDFQQAGREIAGMFDRSKRGTIFWCNFSDQFLSEMQRGVMDALPPERRGDLLLIGEPDQYLSCLRERLLAGDVPQVVFTHAHWTAEIMHLLREVDVTPGKDVQVIADSSVIRKDPEFHGIVHAYPFEEIGEAAARLVQQQFVSPESTKTKSCILKLKIESR